MRTLGHWQVAGFAALQEVQSDNGTTDSASSNGDNPGLKTRRPPKGQGSGFGPDDDDLVVTDDHDIPHVSDSPKTILASLNPSHISQTQPFRQL